MGALANVGADNVVVNTVGLGANTWDVRFVKALSKQNVNPLTGAANMGAAVVVSTRWDGMAPPYVKRTAQNRYDRLEPSAMVALEFDFDNGTATNDAIGTATNNPNLGLGANEGMTGQSDSGSPGLVFISPANRWEIAAVHSYTYNNPANPPDINNYVFGTGISWRDNSFGEIGGQTPIAANRAGFIDPTLTQDETLGVTGRYHLVLDMMQQELGNDGLVEDITIIVRSNNGNLELEVTNQSNPGVLAGIYYTAPFAYISSLTIRGSNDNETINLIGNPGVGVITIDGRDGNDTIVVGAAGGGNLNDVTSNIVINGGAGTNSLIINDAAAPAGRGNMEMTVDTFTWGGTANIQYENITNFTLNDGIHNDTVSFNGVESSLQIAINAGNGYDTVKMIAGAAYNPTLTSVQNLEISGGTITLNANLGIEDFSQSGGTLAGAGTLTITDVASWSGGTMSGTGTTALASTSTATLNGSAKALARQLNNSGDLVWSAGNITASDSAEINNQYGALFDLQGNVSLLDGGSSGQFKNLAGATLLKSAGAGTASLAIPVAANQGLIRITSGTLAGPDTQVLQNSGEIDVDGGHLSALAGFAQNTGGILLIDENSSGTVTGNFQHYDGLTRNAGTITVTGAFQLDDGLVSLDEAVLEAALGIFIEEDAYLVGSGTLDGDVTNGGHIKIGDTDEDNFGLYGELLITGNYTQESTGQLTFDLQDGLDYFFDVLTINGSASLDGTLYINVDSEGGGGENFQMNFSSFGPEEGEYHIIVCDDVTGIFDEEIGDGFTVDYLEDGVWVYLFLNQ